MTSLTGGSWHHSGGAPQHLGPGEPLAALRHPPHLSGDAARISIEGCATPLRCRLLGSCDGPAWPAFRSNGRCGLPGSGKDALPSRSLASSLTITLCGSIDPKGGPLGHTAHNKLERGGGAERPRTHASCCMMQSQEMQPFG